MCLSSNVQTGTAASIAEHPIHHLDRLGFRVTVNPDNRLMSATTLTGEFALLAEAFDYCLKTYGSNQRGKSVFAPYGVRKALVARIARRIGGIEAGAPKIVRLTRVCLGQNAHDPFW